MIIGITGRNGSGKDTIAEIFVKKSFHHFSLSDSLRIEATKRKLEHTADNLRKIGNELREKHGTGILAELAIQNMKKDQNLVITSIRNPGEVEILRKRKDFILVNVDVPASIRFERLQKRGKQGDTIKTIEEFKRLEKEDESKNPAALQTNKVIKMAEVTISNDCDIETLNEKITKFLMDWGPKLRQPRPSWDEYFMRIAMEVSQRGNCMKRKVAAIIVKDKRIISTGYNGTPRGIRNCDEGGCARCNSYGASGVALSECTCSHGEENAIVQAAYHGVSIKGGTMYVTMSPCLICAKMIINAGIVEVVYNADFPLAETSKNLLKEAKVKLRQFKINQI